MRLTKFKIFICICLASMSSTVYSQEETDFPFLDIRLMGADLIDEFAYSWKQNLPIPAQSHVAIVEISAPVGLDTQFNDMVENRLYELFITHKQFPINLVRCAPCTQWVAKSTPQGTVMSRGIDQPEVIEQLAKGAPQLLALSLNFEAEERDLVLRATLFEPGKQQKIVWAKRYTTSRSARVLLRKAEPLISLEEARRDQQMLLEGRDPSQFVTRLTIRNFTAKNNDVAAPLMFAEQSFETTLLPQRRQRAAFTLGFTSIKDTVEAWSAGGHLASLLLQKTPSLTQPDLYWFLGFHYIRMRGPAAAMFQEGQIDVDTLLGGKEPKASLVAWRLGFELMVKYRLGVSAFVEYIPTLNKNDIIAKETLIGIPYHDWGIAMVIKW